MSAKNSNIEFKREITWIIICDFGSYFCLIAFFQLHSTSCRSGSPYRWTMKICLPSPDQCRYIIMIWRDFFDFSCRNFQVVLSYPANSCYARLTDLIAKTINQWTISSIMHCCISGFTSIFITSHPCRKFAFAPLVRNYISMLGNAFSHHSKLVKQLNGLIPTQWFIYTYYLNAV